MNKQTLSQSRGGYYRCGCGRLGLPFIRHPGIVKHDRFQASNSL